MKKLLFSYLKFWAKGYLKRTNPEIIAITGSVGKTSTKEAIFEVLKTKYGQNIRKSEGNLNNESGLPVAILGFKSAPSYEAKNPFGWIWIILAAPLRSIFLKKCKLLVLELAADKPGDIKYLTTIIEPKVAVLTAIGPAHLEAFGKIERIIEEKTDLLRALTNDGRAILNLDDELVRKVSYGGRWQKITYAIENKADVSATSIKTSIENYCPKTSFTVQHDYKQIKIVQATLGERANVLASLAAVAVAKVFKLSDNEISEGLKRIKNEKHRMQPLQGINNSIIIDDSYNANPQSVKTALEVLEKLKGKRKIAVLGDMREIGEISQQAHQQMGKIARSSADLVISVGHDAQKYNAHKYFKTIDKANNYLLKEIREGDIILIKASRAMKLEQIVEAIKEK